MKILKLWLSTFGIRIGLNEYWYRPYKPWIEKEYLHMILDIGSDVGNMELYSKTLNLDIRILGEYKLVRLKHLLHGDS